MLVSGSLRGGNCDVRSRDMTTVRRSAAEADPRFESICVGIWTTWCTCCPATSTSAKPTAAAVSGGALSSVVPSSVTRSVWKLRAGKVRVWPDGRWDAAVRS